MELLLPPGTRRGKPVEFDVSGRAPRVLSRPAYVAVCHTCGLKHRFEIDVREPKTLLEFSDWLVKHPQPHRTEFLNPRRPQSGWRFWERFKRPWWADYLDNANVKVAYAASAGPTFTLNSLAASSTLLAGRQSDEVSNATNLYLDYHVAGQLKSAASNNQAGTILVAVVGIQDDTPTYPDVITNAGDATKTISKQGVFDQVCKLLASVTADNTASQVWPFGPESVAQRFGGFVPAKFVFFVSHNIQTSTNAINSSGNAFRYTPVYATSI